ncbi:Hypothetical protein AT6N2_L2147 [Agrobacterium tumefaciens]|nr:Hypothetical protein AT6N2_L2147 [Agrobacterium tumefaciens]
MRKAKNVLDNILPRLTKTPPKKERKLETTTFFVLFQHFIGAIDFPLVDTLSRSWQDQ